MTNFQTHQMIGNGRTVNGHGLLAIIRVESGRFGGHFALVTTLGFAVHAQQINPARLFRVVLNEHTRHAIDSS